MKYAFLFDMDGVIIDSNPAHKIALKQFCKQHGYDLSDEHLREKIYGRTNKDWIPNLFGKLSADQVKQYADEKEAMFRELYKKDIQPLKGLKNFLEQATQLGVPQAIATSAPRDNVDFTLEHTGIEKHFSAMLDESFVSRGKPDPEIYLKTAAALGVDPRNCVVFEDSLSGVESGKAAGCKVVGLTTTHTAEELSKADLWMADFDTYSVAKILELLFPEKSSKAV